MGDRRAWFRIKGLPFGFKINAVVFVVVASILNGGIWFPALGNALRVSFCFGNCWINPFIPPSWRRNGVHLWLKCFYSCVCPWDRRSWFVFPFWGPRAWTPRMGARDFWEQNLHKQRLFIVLAQNNWNSFFFLVVLCTIYSLRKLFQKIYSIFEYARCLKSFSKQIYVAVPDKSISAHHQKKSNEV